MRDKEVRYLRETSRNYMIFTAPPGAEESYECRMMAENQIPGLLHFEVRRSEEKAEFYYEISSRQPLSRILLKKRLSGEDLRKILPEVAAVLRRTEAFLLEPREILLDPDFIYLNPDDLSACFCLVPGFSEEENTLSGLLKFFLDRVDREDPDGLLIAYNAYQKSLEENYRAEDLLEILRLGESRRIPEEYWRNPEERDRFRRLPEKREESRDFPEEREDARRILKEQEPARPETGIPMKTGRQTGTGFRTRILTEGLLAAGSLLAVSWYLGGRKALAVSGVFLLLAAVGALLKTLSGRSTRRREAAGGCVRAETGGYSRAEEERYSCAETGEYGRPGSGRKTGRERPSEEETRKEIRKETREETRKETWAVSPVRESEERREEEASLRERLRRQEEEGTELISQGTDCGEAPAYLEPVRQGLERIPVAYFPFVIGKHPELTDYAIHKSTVSRMHLSLDRREGITILTDLNSRNGTRVNGYRLEANETVSLASGDTVAIADLEYRFYETPGTG